MLTLIVGLRGSGKSTWAKEHLGEEGLCYDMDAIASAFRLRMPHEEYHADARRMSNDLLRGWLDNVRDYTDDVYVIRTAPRLDELRRIHPDTVVVCGHRYVERDMDDAEAAAERIKQIETYCRAHGVPVAYAGSEDHPAPSQNDGGGARGR